MILLSGMLARQTKRDCKGKIRVVLCLHMRSWYNIGLSAALMMDEIGSFGASSIHARHCFMVLISLSTKTMAGDQLLGMELGLYYFLYKSVLLGYMRRRAWSILKDRETP